MTNYKEVGTEALLIIESGLNYYDTEIMQELADRAGLLEEWNSADGETFESVLKRAIEILKEEL